MAPFSAAASVDDVLLILHWRFVVYSKLGDDHDIHDIQELYIMLFKNKSLGWVGKHFFSSHIPSKKKNETEEKRRTGYLTFGMDCFEDLSLHFDYCRILCWMYDDHEDHI